MSGAVLARLLSDEKLLLRYREGEDQGAFEELVKRYRMQAAATARGLLGNCPHLADDAVQESFARVACHCSRFDCDRSFRAWFFTILRRICYDFQRQRLRQHELRSRAQQDPLFHDGTAHANTLSQASATLEQSNLNEWLLARLSPSDGALLAARFVHDLDFAEIAKRFNCSEDAAKKRAQRALKRLKRLLAGRKASFL